MDDTKAYSIRQNLLYVIHNWFRWDRTNTILTFLRIPVMITIPAITARIPKLMIDAIETQVPLNSFVAILAYISLLVALLS